jgi:hypothetical protein
MNAVIYDAEIVNAIPVRGHKNASGIRYCRGWRDFSGMGVSVVAVCHLGSGKLSHWLHERPADRAALQRIFDEAEHIIGFNTKAFDDKLLAAHGYRVETTYDLLAEVRLASGQPASFVPGRTRAGYTLDALARANGASGKTGSGKLAPVLWQRGERQQVISYCRADVALTRHLFERRHSLKDPNDGRVLTLGNPFAAPDEPLQTESEDYGPLFLRTERG